MRCSLATPQIPVANPMTRQVRPRGIYRFFPILTTLRNYRRDWVLQDVAAGLVLTAVLVPVGMGYAAASGLPAIYGLYATIFPLIAYAIFGPSKILVLGPDSALAGLIAATILPLAAGNVDKAVALASMLAILTGVLCIGAGLARFGFITDLLSKPIREGYLNGIALTVLIGQLPKVLGFSVSGNNFLKETSGLIQGIRDGQINWTACAIGLSCLIVILGFKRWASRIPGVLIAVVGATIIASVLDLSTKTGIVVVGPLPQGLPQFQIPSVSFAEFGNLCAAAVAIALVSFADMSALSRTFALGQAQKLTAIRKSSLSAPQMWPPDFFRGFP